MTLAMNEYQLRAHSTAKYPIIGHPIVYPTLGLAGESGEFADKIKKIFRDHDGKISPELRAQLVKELGDILWYVAECAFQLKVTLEDVAAVNLDKLADRKERDMISGSGDER